MSSKLPNLGINAILNSICSIMSIIFPLITYPYVTRILEPEALGKVNFSSSIVGYFSLLGSLGIATYAAREGVQFRTNRNSLSSFGSEIFTLHIFTTLCSLFILLLAIATIPTLTNYSWLLIIYGATVAVEPLGMGWIFTVNEDYRFLTIKSISIQLMSMILLFLLVRTKSDFIVYAILNASGNVISQSCNFIYSKKYIDKRLSIDIKKSFGHLKGSLIFFSSSIASSIYSHIDMTMLGFFASDYHMGLYATSTRIYAIIKMMLSAIITVMIPRLTLFKSKNKITEFNDLITKVFKIMITIILPVIIGLILVSHELVMVICGNQYEASVPSLRVLSIAIFFAMFATVTNGCVLIPSKLEKTVLKTTICGAVTNCILNYLVIPHFYQNGAAFTTVISEFVVLLCGWNSAKKNMKLGNLNRSIITSLIGCTIICIISFVLDELVFNIYLLLMLKVFVCATIYFTILYLLRNPIIREIGNNLNKIIRR